jgi:hypothetical protein
MKMEAKYSSEASFDFQGNARRYIPEDITPYNHRCENLKSYAVLVRFVSRNAKNKQVPTQAVP